MITPASVMEQYDGVCLSTDTKPTNVPNGTILLEMDTKTMYIFDEENKEWRPWT